jgi:carbamoyltransferase
MAVVLGLSLGHDGAAAIVKDGRLVSGIARERLSRRKKETGVGRAEIDYVCAKAGVTLDQVEMVTFAAYTYRADNQVRVFDTGGREICHNLYDLQPRMYVAEVSVRIGNVAKRGTFVHHHLSHCASAYYTSPFKRAALFSVDASMVRPEACSLFAYADGDKTYPLRCPGMMIGNAYSEFTGKLGLGDGLFKAGSTMGLASYGTPSQRSRERWQHYGQSYYARQYQPDDMLFIARMWSELSGLPPHVALPRDKSDSQEAMDIAASLQYVFEETLVQAANELFEETASFNDGNLCLSGGSFLNCNTNSAIRTRTKFKAVHLFPGCGDDGTAVGSALIVAHHQFGEKRASYLPRDLCYLGRSYPSPSGGEKMDIDAVVEALVQGKVVGWCQGGSEFGPRALGNRSILADPRSPTARDHINAKVKRREWFRPFAPSVLAEHVSEWFHFEGASPFMLYTAAVREPDRVPAISHVDGTARPQTVTREDNPLFYELIDRFRAATGVPMLLNTSLNGKDEPLVETPEDALRFWKSSPIDVMVIGDAMFRR